MALTIKANEKYFPWLKLHDQQLNAMTFQAWKIRFLNFMTFQVFQDLSYFLGVCSEIYERYRFIWDQALFEFFIPQINIIPVSMACTGQIEKELLTKGCLLGYMHYFIRQDY